MTDRLNTEHRLRFVYLFYVSTDVIMSSDRDHLFLMDPPE